MTKAECKQVAELMIRISDVVVAAERIDLNDPLWYGACVQVDESKNKLQQDIKRLIGIYVPIG